MQNPTKFLFKVRCRNGFVVSNLRINGNDFVHARTRLEQMYPRCSLLEYQELGGYKKPGLNNTTETNIEQTNDEGLSQLLKET
jgi:hypothetical protein